MVGEGFQLTEKSPPYFITSLFVGSFWDFSSQSTKNVLGRKKRLKYSPVFLGGKQPKTSNCIVSNYFTYHLTILRYLRSQFSTKNK